MRLGAETARPLRQRLPGSIALSRTFGVSGPRHPISHPFPALIDAGRLIAKQGMARVLEGVWAVSDVVLGTASAPTGVGWRFAAESVWTSADMAEWIAANGRKTPVPHR